MDIRNELKGLIAQNGTTLKKICDEMSEKFNKKVIGNNITNKLRRNTIKFQEVQEILDVMGYNIVFVRKN